MTGAVLVEPVGFLTAIVGADVLTALWATPAATTFSCGTSTRDRHLDDHPHLSPRRASRLLLTRPEDLTAVMPFVVDATRTMVGPIDLHEGTLFTGIVDFFEEGVAAPKRILELIGDDVVAFCNDLVKDSLTYADIHSFYGVLSASSTPVS